MTAALVAKVRVDGSNPFARSKLKRFVFKVLFDNAATNLLANFGHR